jgi:NAD+ kinase
MTMPLNLVLVRHGQSEGNVAFNLLKEGDDSMFTSEFADRHTSLWRLTDKGIEQARIAGDWLKEEVHIKFDRYYTSEYFRALETAAHMDIAEAQWFPEFYLRERDYGDLDSYSLEERREYFKANHRSIDKFYWSPPNGESMAQLCLRVDRFLHTLHRECSDKSVVAVCHGDLIWAFRIRLERIYPYIYEELKSAGDERILNGQIVHYTRQDPWKGNVINKINWVKSVCPNNLHLSSNEWKSIHRAPLSNEKLLSLVEGAKRIINK